MANWGADFWGAYGDVARAHAAKMLATQDQAARSAMGNALMGGALDNIYLPQAPAPGQSSRPMQGPGQLGDMSREANAISGIESGGNYGALGPATRTGDRAYGKYQVMGANVGPWTAAAGHQETPQQFLQDKTMQDAVFRQQFGANERKYGPQGAASMWFTGRPNAPNARDVNGTSGNQYVQRFTQLMGQSPGQVAQTASQIGGAPPGQMSWQHIVAAIVARNPGIKPAVLADAVQLFQPLMSQQSQMDWREQQMALREQGLQLQEARLDQLTHHQDVTENQGQQKIDAQAVRAKMANDWKYAGLAERRDEFEKKMKQSTDNANRKYYADQRRANNTQRHQRFTELLQQGSFNQGQPIDADTQKQLMAAEQERYDQENAQIAADEQAAQPEKPYQAGDQHAVPKGAVYAPGTKPLNQGSSDDTPPASYTGKNWKYLTPEQRKLWQ